MGILPDSGGKARASVALAEIENRFGGSFTKGHLEFESHGTTLTWWKTTQWEPNGLVLNRIMKSDSPNGMWELLKK